MEIKVFKLINLMFSNNSTKVYRTKSEEVVFGLQLVNGYCFIKENGQILSGDSDNYEIKPLREANKNEAKKAISLYNQVFGIGAYKKAITEEKLKDINILNIDTSEYEDC